jgi:hypothetical protein
MFEAIIIAILIAGGVYVVPRSEPAVVSCKPETVPAGTKAVCAQHGFVFVPRQVR